MSQSQPTPPPLLLPQLLLFTIARRGHFPSLPGSAAARSIHPSIHPTAATAAAEGASDRPRRTPQMRLRERLCCCCRRPPLPRLSRSGHRWAYRTGHCREKTEDDMLAGDCQNVLGQMKTTTETGSGSHNGPVEVDEEQLAKAARHVITSSHYHGTNKDRLYDAVLQTVRGELPLTQAAAAHSIPFSTLHPYVKKVRVKLGILDLSDASPTKRTRFRPFKRAHGNNNGIPRRQPAGVTVRQSPLLNGVILTNGHHQHPALDGHDESPVPVMDEQVKKSRRQPAAGYQPFKQIEIPEAWKQQPAAMQEAVWGAVSGCQYDDPMKKERLCSAVMEALSGQKTMKAAAATHEVPFTTLQTYFHRSRAKLQRVLGDGTDVGSPSSTIDQIPVSVSLLSSESPTSMDMEDWDHQPSRNIHHSGSGGAVGELDQLLARMQRNSPSDDEEPFNGGTIPFDEVKDPKIPPSVPVHSPKPAPTGSNKRKPQKVHRFVENPISTIAPIVPTKTDEDVAEQHVSPIMAHMNAMAAAQNATKKEETEEIPFEIDENVLRIEPTAPEDDMEMDNVMAMDEDQEEDMEFSSPPVKRRKPNGNVGGAIEHESGVMTREDAIDRAIRNCHYEKDNRQRLRWALLDALEKTLTLKQAAREYQIPLSTLNTYYMRSKAIHTQANQFAEKFGLLPTSSTIPSSSKRPTTNEETSTSSTIGTSGGSSSDTPSRMAKERDMGPVITGPALDPSDTDRIQFIETTVDEVCKASLYSNEQKRRLFDAVMLVVKGDCTINAAANMKQLPSSTVHPYVHKARAILGLQLPPQASGPTLWASSRKKGDGACGEQSEDGGDAPPSPVPSSTDGSSGDTKPSSVKSSEDAGNEALDLEQLDRIIAGLVKNSHYDESGRQKLYEATLMVLTENVTASEAARFHKLPASTIQPYVHKARIALGLPTVSSTSSGTPAVKRSAPVKTQYAKPGCEAPAEEVQAVVEQVLANCNAQAERREKLMAAVLAAVAGKSTIKDACTAQGLPASTVHPYVSKARHMLGDKCPVPKIVLTANATVGNSNTPNSTSNSNTPVPLSMVSVAETSPVHSQHVQSSTSATRIGSVTKTRTPIKTTPIPEPVFADDDGSSDEEEANRVPTTVRGVARMLSRKEIAESEKKDFIGDRAELMKRIMKIMRRYDYRGDRTKMCEAIMTVLLEGKTLAELSAMSGLAQTTLSTYVRLAKYFLNTDTMIVTDAPPRSTPRLEKTSKPMVAKQSHPISLVKVLENLKAEEPAIPVKNEVDGQKLIDTPEHRVKLEERISAAVSESLPIAEPDIMHLHNLETLDDEEGSLKMIISYLISQQYKRGEAQQRKMRDAVEEVLLNGLSTNESLSIHRGLTEHVLQVYLGRCRDAYKCILSEFPIFLQDVEEMTDVVNGHTPPSGARSVSSRRTSSNASSIATIGVFTPTRTSRRLQAAHTVRQSVDGEIEQGNEGAPPAGTINLLSEAQVQPLVKYLSKLNHVNFPLESKLISGLALIAQTRNGQEPPVEATAKQWTEWVARFRKKYRDFDE